MKNIIKAKDPDEITIDMPEVKDIPGQEHIKPPLIREMMDTTISSDDEEGKGLLDDLNKEEEDALMDDESNVSEDEKRFLALTDEQQNEETEDLKKLALDDIDEASSAEQGNPADMGEDLDIPGSELDDENEDIGEEDEENNSYSRPD